MKYLILFLLVCFSANANYVKKAKVQSKNITKVFVKNNKCGADCIKLPKNFNLAFYVMVDVMIDDITKPVNSKSEIESCSDQTDCESKNEVKNCDDQDEIVIMAEDFAEIYCSKHLRYEQMASGEKEIVIDEDLKAAFLADKQSKATIAKNKRDEINGDILIRLKGNSVLTQVQIKKLFLHLLGQ